MFIRLILSLVVLGAGAVLLPRLYTELHARSRLFAPSDAPEQPVAVVFGAGLWRDGSPSPVLRDRIATAADLFFQGKVQKLLMSGDNRFEDYNEPGAMRQFALDLGVPEEAIVLDFAGRRTYDTCYRARDIFGLESAILVPQRSHLPRALYPCNPRGLPAVGVPADRRGYLRRTSLFWSGREAVATLVALWELHITRPLPVLGEPEPIFAHLEGP